MLMTAGNDNGNVVIMAAVFAIVVLMVMAGVIVTW
jgi:hypothetical protein